MRGQWGESREWRRRERERGGREAIKGEEHKRGERISFFVWFLKDDHTIPVLINMQF